MMAKTVAPLILKANETPGKWGVNILLYGLPGVGKTHFAGTAQDFEPARDVLVVDVEGGSRTLSNRKDIDITKPKSWSALQDTYNWVREGDHKYKTIVVDTLSEAQAMAVQHVLKNKAKQTDSAELQDFGKATDMVTLMVRAFKSLAQEDGYNIIFTAHLREDRDDSTGAIMQRPALMPRLSEIVTASVDVVGYYSTVKDGREMRLHPGPNIIAKVRIPGGSEKPFANLKNPTFKSLYEALMPKEK